MSLKFSRRQFLIASGVSATGGLLAACGGAQPQAETQAPAVATSPAAAEPAVAGSKYTEAPALAERVKAGTLPPVDERLPIDPFVSEIKDSIGKYGGKLSSVVADPTGQLFETWDARTANIARLSMDLSSIEPWIAAGWEISDDYKELTVHLREGLKWSDGTPLTTEHVSFWYEDMLLNEDLTPVIETPLMPGGEPITLIVDDEYTFRVQFAVPYPTIIDTLPTLEPNRTRWWSPKQFLSKWHIKYNEDANALAQEEGFASWVEAFEFHRDESQTQQDADLPVLGAWVFDNRDTQGNTLYVRNPYYWAVDPEGNQLPYADELERLVVENREVLTAKVLSGETTHHSWFLTLADFPLYKQNEEAGNYTTRLHPDLRASEMGFAFNYTHQDEVLRELFNDVRWRQALSHAMNREEINELRFAGLGTPRNPIMHPGPSFWEDGMDQYYTEYNVDLANQLLDDVGLVYDADGKFRLRPDGQPMTLTMEHDAGRADYAETCNLIRAYWADVGVDVTVKPQDAQFLTQRWRANEHDIAVNAIGGGSEPYSRQNEPIRYRPPWHWPGAAMGGPLWRQWLDTDGAEGMEPPEIIKELWEITLEWQTELFGTDRYKELGKQMLTINAENVWLIGTVGLVPRVSIISNTVRNYPTEEDILSIEYNMWRYHLIQQWWIDE